MPPAFLFLIPAMSNSWAGARFGVWSVTPRRPEVAAYTAAEFCVNTFFSTFCRAISANRKTSDFEPKSHPEPFDRPRLVRHFREAAVSTDPPSPRQHRFSPKLQKGCIYNFLAFLAKQNPLSRLTGPTNLRHSRSKPPYRICSGALASKKFACYAHFCRRKINLSKRFESGP